MKNIGGFYLKMFQFLEVKSSICLNRHVFVMLKVSPRSFPFNIAIRLDKSLQRLKAAGRRRDKPIQRWRREPKRKQLIHGFFIFPLRKQAYSNVLNISLPKTESFQTKKF